MKRVHIGGLFDGVKETDLKDRFGKFGKISSVEIKSKHTATGDSKVFAFMNIAIDDDSLKRCMKLYNNTKWKGNELQLQLAKAHFMERLHEEQKLTKDLEESEPIICAEVDTDVSAGHREIRETTVKDAKPGTEVKDMKNWVVGKYGRVLPVVYIRKKDKKKIMKVDPSKYCHAVKKIDQKDGGPCEKAVSDLTWEVNVPDSDIVKKRMGQFPEYTPKRRRPAIKRDSSHSNSDSDQKTVSKNYNSSPEEDETESVTDFSAAPIQTVMSTVNTGEDAAMSASEPIKGLEIEAQSRREKWKKIKEKAKKKKLLKIKGNKFNNSKPEIKQTLKQTVPVKTERKLNKRQRRLLINSNGEAKESNHEAVESLKLSKNGRDKGASGEEEYDSAGTDEIIACKKKVAPVGCTGINVPISKISAHMTNTLADEYYGGLQDGYTRARGYTSDNESDCDVFDSIAKGKLTKLYRSKKTSVEETSTYMSVSKTNQLEKLPIKHLSTVEELSTKHSFSTVALPSKKINKTESVSSESDKTESVSSESDKTESVSSESDTTSEESSAGEQSPKQVQTKVQNSQVSAVVKSQTVTKEQINDERIGQTHTKSPIVDGVCDKHKGSKTDKKDISSEEMNKSGQRKNKEEPRDEMNSKKLGMDKSLSKDNETQQPDVTSMTKIEKKKKKSTGIIGDKKIDKHKLSNQQRLQSLSQRQEESESKRTAIQKALSSVDSKLSNKKVVFDSDSDEEPPSTSSSKLNKDTDTGVKPQHTKHESESTMSTSSSSSSSDDSEEESSGSGGQAVVQSGKKHERKSTQLITKPATSLFDNSSEDEDSDQADRFKVREEFEGKAGRKLMELQSKFSHDKRFKLDKSFLEEGDDQGDESSEEEKREDGVQDKVQTEVEKSLQILASVVKGVKVASAKADKNATSFRDISSMRFDPSIEDHHHLEIKPDAGKVKEAKKSKKKKKKELEEVKEDDPLPEVSVDKFFEVEKNLKDIFQPEKRESFSLLSMFGSTNEVTETTAKSEEKCKVIEPDQMPWQKNFSYDSSEDEEIQQRQKITDSEDLNKPRKDVKDTVTENTEENSFFCMPDDPRIEDGMNTFCRTEGMDEVRVKWQEKRPDLVEMYRKRRKQALRKSKGARQQFKFNKMKKPGNRS